MSGYRDRERLDRPETTTQHIFYNGNVFNWVSPEPAYCGPLALRMQPDAGELWVIHSIAFDIDTFINWQPPAPTTFDTESLTGCLAQLLINDALVLDTQLALIYAGTAQPSTEGTFSQTFQGQETPASPVLAYPFDRLSIAFRLRTEDGNVGRQAEEISVQAGARIAVRGVIERS